MQYTQATIYSSNRVFAFFWSSLDNVILCEMSPWRDRGVWKQVLDISTAFSFSFIAA